jgi:hypothetical protein
VTPRRMETAAKRDDATRMAALTLRGYASKLRTDRCSPRTASCARHSIHLARYTMAVLMTRWRTSTPFARPSSAATPVIRRHRAAIGARQGRNGNGGGGVHWPAGVHARRAATSADGDGTHTQTRTRNVESKVDAQALDVLLHGFGTEDFGVPLVALGHALPVFLTQILLLGLLEPHLAAHNQTHALHPARSPPQPHTHCMADALAAAQAQPAEAARGIYQWLDVQKFAAIPPRPALATLLNSRQSRPVTNNAVRGETGLTSRRQRELNRSKKCVHTDRGRAFVGGGLPRRTTCGGRSMCVSARTCVHA